MGESNDDWGQLASVDTELADAWDSYARLPEPGVSAALDGFVAEKRITIGALVRLGAKMMDDYTIAFATSHGIKYRHLVSGHRHSFPGSEFPTMRIVPKLDPSSDGSVVLIAEGETDAARLSDGYPGCDVAVMPAGAKYFPSSFVPQLEGYSRVLVALDDDKAGNEGAAMIMSHPELPTERFVPPESDWCETATLPPLPAPPSQPEDAPYMMSVGTALAYEVPERESYFDDALLPVSGQLILHGWAKNFKTFLGLDAISALAQGTNWGTFQNQIGPVKVGIVQYEIVWAYYRKRLAALREAAAYPELFDENVMLIGATTRPKLTAGNTEQEDKLIGELMTAHVEVLLIDPVRRALGTVNINDSKDIRPVLAFAERLSDAGIATILTHHDNKASARAGGGSPLSMTGAGDFAGDADSIVSIAVPTGLTLEQPKRNLHFTLRNGPSPSARGFLMGDDGHLQYSHEPYGEGINDEEDTTQPQI